MTNGFNEFPYKLWNSLDLIVLRMHVEYLVIALEKFTKCPIGSVKIR